MENKQIQNPIAEFETAEKLGLLREEYDKICKTLGRKPNFTEISMYSVMWSEHCSYKNSIFWLKTLPKDGPQMLAKAGEENAGLVDIGDGLGCAFKIESHNHPSAVEPYQGAATGVGGINRDIFTMGARPIAQLNSLRFGNIDEDRTKWLLKGVVKGIGDYGNSFGVPVVGGELVFEDCYQTNILVNAMSVGIVEDGGVVSATSHGEGNPVFIVGSSTGKDGIHGATFASGDITEDSSEDLPSVQVGDPFQEKLLLEASLEVIKTGAVIGMQDMGAAGIVCSTSEMSEKGGAGMIINLDKVPLRQKDMQPFEILLSESQERMLVVVEKGREQEILDVFDKWDLNCVEIGVVTDKPILQYYWHGELVAEVPSDDMVLGGGAPIYEREYSEPAYFAKTKEFDINDIKEEDDLRKVAEFMIKHPNIASKRWVTDQYDSMVRTVNLSTNFPSDAGIINVKGTEKALAVSTDCNSSYVYADPFVGTQIAVAEAARNVVCTGGIPSAITNCLNFGNPYNPEVYWQFVNAIKGMSSACLKFKTPVTGGNVSFYNQSNIDGKVEAVYPTPVIGMLGIIEDKQRMMSLDFKTKGDLIFLLGENHNDISSSEYLKSWHGVKLSPTPYFDLDKEYELQKHISSLINNNLVNTVHDVSNGGLYTSLIEMAMPNMLGFDITTISEIRDDAFLFGESQSRIVVAVSQLNEAAFMEYVTQNNVETLLLGHVTKGSIRVNDESWGSIIETKELFDTSIEKKLEEK